MSEDNRLRAEDLPIGEVVELGTWTVTREEIIGFATQWDPQPFHIDPDFARATTFGDVIGSGLHTMAIFQRLAVLNLYRHWAVIAGRALRNVQLTAPLRPDTTVRATVRVDSVTPHRADRSLVRKTGKVTHEDAVLMTLEVESYVLRRT
jgi:acyl dehydratase